MKNVRVIKILWSIVSKAAAEVEIREDRESETGNFLWTNRGWDNENRL